MRRSCVARVRRERIRERNSEVRRERGRVEGPEAWRMRERVRRKRGRRGGSRRGVEVPLLGGKMTLIID